jgi:hypothetical protein
MPEETDEKAKVLFNHDKTITLQEMTKISREYRQQQQGKLFVGRKTVKAPTLVKKSSKPHHLPKLEGSGSRRSSNSNISEASTEKRTFKHMLVDIVV